MTALALALVIGLVGGLAPAGARCAAASDRSAAEGVVGDGGETEGARATISPRCASTATRCRCGAVRACAAGCSCSLLGVAFAIASASAWRMTLGRTPRVQVAIAERSAPGAAPAAGAVLTGSGYVVTGERYISLGVRVPSRIERYPRRGGPDGRARPGARRSSTRASTTRRSNEARASLAARARQRRPRRARSSRAPAHWWRRTCSRSADLDVKENQLRVAEAEVAQLEAAVARAEVDLEDTVIRAPTPA